MEFSFDSWFQQGAIIGKVGKWVEVYWGQPQLFASEAELTSPAIYKTSFFRESAKPWMVFPNSQRWDWKDWRVRVREEAKKRAQASQDLKWQEPKSDDFKKIFNEIKKEIKAHKIVKAVPVVYTFAEKVFSQESSMLSAMIQSPKNTHIFGVWNPQEGFFGFSPEVLFTSDKKGLIKTMALAGTRKKEFFQQDPEEFLKDPKEIKEHQIVVDDILQRLSTLGKTKTGKTSFLELNYLTHLYTPLQVQTKEQPLFADLIRALHPTPALGISPREQLPLLKKWRDEKEILGAPFGVRWNAEQFLCLVAIRKVQWDEKFYYIGNGCGVVEESRFEEEWKELKMKRESVKRTFSL